MAHYRTKDEYDAAYAAKATREKDTLDTFSKIERTKYSLCAPCVAVLKGTDKAGRRELRWVKKAPWAPPIDFPDGMPEWDSRGGRKVRATRANVPDGMVEPNWAELAANPVDEGDEE